MYVIWALEEIKNQLIKNNSNETDVSSETETVFSYDYEEYKKTKWEPTSV